MHSAIEHLHDLDYCHNDVLVNNIMIDEGGGGVLIDVGFFRLEVEGVDALWIKYSPKKDDDEIALIAHEPSERL